MTFDSFANVLTPVPADKVAKSEGRPLRILVVSAQPMSAAALSLEQEEKLIRSSFQSLIDRKAVVVEVLAEATPDELHARVRCTLQDEIDVVHFMGHGRFDDDTETGYLIFEDGARNVHELSTNHVKDILRGRGIKLVFLNACQTGRGSRADYNKGVAPGLVADGVPAVVANQYSVLDRSATTFARHFYWCLAQGLTLGDAAREARIALNYSGGGLIGWAVPVLFARNPDAVLCRTDVLYPDRAPAGVEPTLPTADMPRFLAATTLLSTGPATIKDFPSTTAQTASAFVGQSATGLPKSIPGMGSTNAQPPTTVAVWDVNDAVPELEPLLSAMNSVQKGIEFRVATLTAPYGLWRADGARFGSTAYLPAERTAKQLKRLLALTRADYLLCISDLPLADKEVTNLYTWFGDNGNDPELHDNRVILFSTWGFDPPLRGPSLQRALTNIAVQSLAGLLAKDADISTAKGTLGYFNPERDMKQITGRLRIGGS